MTKLKFGSKPCTCGRNPHDVRLIAVTGGPGAGKTAILEMALRSFCAHVGVLPEAAGVVFGGGFPRLESDAGRRSAQRAIFHIQRELEALVMGEGQFALALCDRGTVDGIAYWPDPVDTFWQAVGATHQAEISRYFAVIHLRTPTADQGYNQSNNSLRVESAAEAQELDRRIMAAWEGHPNRFIVSSEHEFVHKAARALDLVRSQVPACCHR